MKMSKNILIALSVVCVFTTCKSPREEELSQHIGHRVVDYVDPFIGTGGHGHTFPGATVPFGMVQLSPDNGTNGWDWCSGYHYSDSIIVGFSHTHLSGTGIGDLADILFMPAGREVQLNKKINTRADYPYKSRYSHENETASPGYYSVYLDDAKTKVELTASRRCGFHRYTFDEKQPSVILDLSFAINWDHPTDTKITVQNDSTIAGYRMSSGWAKDQRVYFVAKFSHPFSNYQLFDSTAMQNGSQITGQACKAKFDFEQLDENTLELKVGLSSASINGAMKSVGEIGHWDFDKVKEEAENLWETELSKIKVESDNERDKVIFYTALYHTNIVPYVFSDPNGAFKNADGQIDTANDYTRYTVFSLWDTFRAEHPLFTITQPDKVNDFIKSLLSHYDAYGYLPVWELAGNETNTMTGYHAIPVITDAYFKGFRGYDVEKAYEAMKTSGMQDIRDGNYYKEYGYLPADLVNESVTKNLEYAYDDWCIAQVAKDLGKMDDYEYFINRSQSYKQVFDPETKFMRGKLSDGSWRTPFDPKYSQHRVNTDYTEGNAWQHSWFVPHDVDGLIELMGGKDAFIEKLDALFNEDSNITGEHVSADISGLIGQYAHGNEPSHHIAYLYNYAGASWKTQEMVKQILNTMYTDKPDGLSGNEDCGQMSAWYVFSSLGFYPVNPAEGKYIIGTPIYDKAVIALPEGKSFTISANDVSSANKYIQSAQLNGKPLTRSYITHEEIENGGSLEFQMGNEPNKKWGIDNKNIVSKSD